MNNASAISAQWELQRKIKANRPVDALEETAWELCTSQVPLEEAVGRLQEKALEGLVKMLDPKILADAEATQCCLDLIATESERVAWKALEKGTERLHRGLEMLEGLESMDESEGLEGLVGGAVN